MFITRVVGVQNNIPSPLGEGWGEGNAGKCAPSPRSSPEGEDEVSSIGNFPPEAQPWGPALGSVLLISNNVIYPLSIAIPVAPLSGPILHRF